MTGKAAFLLLLGIVLFAAPLNAADAHVGLSSDTSAAESMLVRIQGIVESRPEGTQVGIWVVAGQAVRVAESTRIDETHGSALVGASVVVLAKPLNAAYVAETAYEAVSICVLPTTDAVNRVIVIRGRISELETTYLVVNDLKVFYDRSTQINGHLVVGAYVEIRAARMPWGLKALAIKVRPPEDRIVEFEGAIERISHPEWVVAGRRVKVTRETTIVGRPEVGLNAKVRARVESNGELLALLIVVTNDWPVVIEWTGPIERLPPQPSTLPESWQGLWVVGGRAVMVTGETEIRGRPRVGLTAHVKALRYPWRPLMAKRITVLSVAPVEPLGATP